MMPIYKSINAAAFANNELYLALTKRRCFWKLKD